MYTFLMTNRLEEAIELLMNLPDDDQERAANALIAFAVERSHYTPSDDDECENPATA